MRVRVIQIRTEDFLRDHEMECVVRTSGLSPDEVESFDAITHPLSLQVLDGADAIVIGGSGEYSATQDTPLHDALSDIIRVAYERQVPTIGLCFGHHMMARALGGRVVTDSAKAETGTVEVSMLPEAADDPLLAGLPTSFYAAQGHNDSVVDIPATLQNLMSSKKSQYQAVRAPGRPFYGLQFHPELRLEDLKQRLSHYGYLNSPERVATLGTLRESPPEVQSILRRFVDQFVRPRLAV